MADDEFAQQVKGQFQTGDAIASTDYLLPIAGKDGSGNALPLDVTTSGVLVRAVSLDVRNLNSGTDSVAVTGTVTATGQVVVSATDLDIRNLVPSQDEVKIGDGTNTLDINPDGSINVVTSVGASSNHKFGTANLVKDTPTIVTQFQATGSSKKVRDIIVSGEGKCRWSAYIGTTGDNTDTTSAIWWSGVSMPTFQAFLENVSVTQTSFITVYGENKELKNSPASDFIGYCTIITE